MNYATLGLGNLGDLLVLLIVLILIIWAIRLIFSSLHN